MTILPTDRHITYLLQYRTCGKARCSTCERGPGHGPYWYAYWREQHRVRSGYVGKVLPAERRPTGRTTRLKTSTSRKETSAVSRTIPLEPLSGAVSRRRR